MSIKLDCPVCGYKEIEKDVCPNCDTDLSLIRMLQELPQLDVTEALKYLEDYCENSNESNSQDFLQAQIYLIKAYHACGQIQRAISEA